MIDINSLDSNVRIDKILTYNDKGQPTIDAQISVPAIEQLALRIYDLESKMLNLSIHFDAFNTHQKEITALIQSNPTLKDAYEKYAMLLTLTQQHK